MPGSGSLSQTDILTYTWTGQRDVESRRNTLFSGDLAYDNRGLSEQHFTIASATAPTNGSSVGSNWYGRRLIFSGDEDKIIQTKHSGDIVFLEFIDDHQVNSITDPDQAWPNENATYSKNLFKFRQTGEYRARLVLNHLSPDSRGVAVRFFEVNGLTQADKMLAEHTFKSLDTQNLPTTALGGTQTAKAYTDIMEIPPFRIDAIGLSAKQHCFVMYEKLNNVNSADVFTGRLELIRIGD